MEDFNVTILGNGSAVPTAYQHPTSQLLQYRNQRFLIDCGEGAQIQMIRYKISVRKINRIFISHLHGDHYFGLVGLLSTLHLYGHKKAVHLYAPGALKSLLDWQFQLSDTRPGFDLVFHPLPEQGLIYEDKNMTVHTFPLNHRIETHGFVFREKQRDRKLSKTFVKNFQPGIEQMQQIKKGADFLTPEGDWLKNSEITLDPPAPRAYAYCSDTAYDERIIPHIHGVDALYHEATFDDEMAHIAKEKYHATARQAAQIARNAKVKKLLLGHFSARFKDHSALLAQAREVFNNSVLTCEGEKYAV